MMSNRETIVFAGCLRKAGEGTPGTARDWPGLVLLGICDDTQSSYRRGAAEAPERIRRVYDGRCYNSTSESGVDLSRAVEDWGDLQPRATWELSAGSYADVARRAFRKDCVPFFMGGDHAVTVPLVGAAAERGDRIQIIQLDAHADLYPSFEGNPDSHACVAYRLLEMEHVAGVTQLGVRTLNQIQTRQAGVAGERLNIREAFELDGGLTRQVSLDRHQSLYVTLDMDVFDPAFAPGVAHPVPGGLTPRQVLNFLRSLPGTLVGMDVVEVNPGLDEGDRTALLAARLLHEAMATAVLQRIVSPSARQEPS